MVLIIILTLCNSHCYWYFQNFFIIQTNPLNNNPHLRLPWAPGNPYSTFCLSEFSCSPCLVEVELCRSHSSFRVWPFGDLLWRKVVQVLHLCLDWAVLLWLLLSCRVLYVFLDMNPISGIYDLQIFPLILGVIFLTLQIVSFWCTNVFKFDEIQFIHFPFDSCASSVISKNSSLTPLGKWSPEGFPIFF